jgi:hypothetical protein
MHPFKQKMLRQEEEKREIAAIAHEAERTRRRALAKEERTGGGLAGMQARAQERAAAFESKQKASAVSVVVGCLWLFGCGCLVVHWLLPSSPPLPPLLQAGDNCLIDDANAHAAAIVADWSDCRSSQCPPPQITTFSPRTNLVVLAVGVPCLPCVFFGVVSLVSAVMSALLLFCLVNDDLRHSSCKSSRHFLSPLTKLSFHHKSPSPVTVPTQGTGVYEGSRKAFAKEFKKVIDVADVILEVLDARDPLGCRCASLERQVLAAGSGKRLVLVLNKVDLVGAPVLPTFQRVCVRCVFVFGNAARNVYALVRAPLFT